MDSQANSRFWKAFDKLPDYVKENAKKNFILWKQNPFHPSLEFKLININKSVYSIRIGLNWRALGIKEDNILAWFWIGSHSDYDQLISSF